MARHPRFVLSDDHSEASSDDDEPSTPYAPPAVVVSSPDAGTGTGSGGSAPMREKTSSDTQVGGSAHERGRSEGDGKETFPPRGEDAAAPPPTTDADDNKPPAKKPRTVPSFLAFIPPHLNWKGWRPVIRASVSAWCGLLLLVCTNSERVLGQASFLVLIGQRCRDHSWLRMGAHRFVLPSRYHLASRSTDRCAHAVHPGRNRKAELTSSPPNQRQ